MNKYGELFLKEKGFFNKSEGVFSEEIMNKKIIIDKNNNLVYAIVLDRKEAQEIYNEIKYKYNIDYYWFSYNNDESIVIYKRYGENSYFTYDPRYSQQKSKTSKISKINNIDKKGLKSIFENEDLVNTFYSDLWDIREEIAENIGNKISIKSKLSIAERYIDRLIFINFLIQKKLIAEKKNKTYKSFPFNRYLNKTYEKNKKDFSKELYKIFKDLDDSEEEYIYEIDGENIKIYIPHIDGGLFDVDWEIEGIKEKDFEFENLKINWKKLFNIFEKYNWLITVEDIKFDEDLYDESKENITPEILGHIYEKFAISLEKYSADFDKTDKKEIKKKIDEARKGKGVYYTPEEITLYISKNTIWPFIKDKIGTNEKDFEDFIKNAGNNELEIAFEELRNIKICDPACGSGAFLLQAAEILYKWEKRILKKIGKDINNFEIKKNIVLNNIYGVDIQPGSVEIAKLRLWLWFSSEQKKGEVKQLPNLEYNIMEGNSLIGFTSLDFKFKQLSEKLIENIESIQTLKKEYKEENTSKKKIIKKFLEKSIHELRKSIDDLFISYLNYNYKNKKNICDFIIKKSQIPYLYNKEGKEIVNKKSFYKEDFYKLKPFHWAVEFYEIFKNGGFDIIIGNPPYGNINKDDEKKVLKIENTLNLKESVNGASLFIERVFSIMKKNAFFSFIVPNSVARVEQFSYARKILLNKQIIEIIDEGSPFKGVTLEMITFIIKNCEKESSIKILSKRDFVKSKINLVESKIFKENDCFIMYYDQLFQIISRDSETNKLDAVRGGDIPNDHFSKTNRYKYKNLYLYSGKSIKKYLIDTKNLSSLDNYYKTKNTFNEEYESERILSPKIYSYPRCIYKPKNLFLYGPGVIRIIAKNKLKSYILLLNSKLISLFCYKYLLNYAQLTIALNTGIIPKIPIKKKFEENDYSILCDINSYSFQKNLKYKFDKISNYLIYEIYFEKILKEKNLYQDLNSKVERILEPINYDEWVKLEFKNELDEAEKKLKIKIEEENEKIIERIYNKLNQQEITNAISEMNKFEWIKKIEEEIKD